MTSDAAIIGQPLVLRGVMRMRRHDEQLLTHIREWKNRAIPIGVVKSAIVAWCEETLRVVPVQPTESRQTASFQTGRDVVDLATSIAEIVNDGTREGESIRECFRDLATNFSLSLSGEESTEVRARVWDSHGTTRTDETFAEGRYIVFEPPVVSGESEVWKVQDIRTSKPPSENRVDNEGSVRDGRFVAMKRPKRAALRSVRLSRQAAKRLLAEARRAAMLEHPNICPVYDVFEGNEEESPYYTMRFLEEATLENAIQNVHKSVRSGTATIDTWRQVVGHLNDAASGVAYAHSKGFAHLDLKPKNIAVTLENGTQVLDWGMASRLEAGIVVTRDSSSPSNEDLTFPQTSQSNWGTPAYAAPEQWQRLACSPRTDVFQLGAVLFEIMTGRPPLGIHSPDFTHLCGVLGVVPDLERVLASKLRSDRRLAQLASICKKAMQPDPKQRYDSLANFQRDLRHWRSDEPVSTFPETISSHAARFWRKFRPAIVAAGIVLGVVTSATVVFYSLTIVKLKQEFAVLEGAKSFLDQQVKEQQTKLVEQLMETKTARQDRDVAVEEADQSHSSVALRMMNLSSRDYQHGHDISSLAHTIHEVMKWPGKQTQRLNGTYPDSYIRKVSAFSKPNETRLNAHSGRVIALWYSDDGSELRSASADGTIRVWDTTTHKVNRIIPIHRPDAAGYAGLGIATSDGTPRISVVVPHSPSSEILPPLSVGDEVIAVGDPESSMEPTSGFDQQGIVKRISGAIGTEVAIKVRSAKNATERTITIRRRASATSFSPGLLNQFSPDGQWLAFTVGINQFAVASAETGRIQWPSPQVNGVIAALAFTPDSQQLAWGELNKNQTGGGTVKISDVRTGKTIRRVNHNSTINGVGFDPAGRMAFARWSSGGKMGAIDLSQPVDSSIAFTEWESRRGRGVHMTVSPAGRWLFHGGDSGRDGNVVYDVLARCPAWVAPDSGQVSAAVFDSQDQLLAVAEIQGTTRILAAEGGTLLASRNGKNILSLAFAPHSEVLAIGDENDICLWRYRERDAEVPSKLVNAPNSVTAATFDKHSGKLLVARGGTNMMKVASPSLVETYRHSTGQLLERWPEPASVTATVDLSPDGSKAVLSRRSFVLGEPAQIDFVDLDTGMFRTVETDCPNLASVTCTNAGKLYLADDPESNFFKQFESNQSRWPSRRGSLQLGDSGTETLSFAKSKDRPSGLLVDRDGDVVIGLGHSISLRDPDTLDFRSEIPVARKQTDLTLLSSDGRWLAVLNPLGEKSGESCLYNLATGRKFGLPGNLTGMLESAFTSDGEKLLVINNITSQRLIYQTPTGDSIEAPIQQTISGMETSPRSQHDGKSFFLWSGKNKVRDLKRVEVPEGTIVEISAETGETSREIGREDGLTTLSSPTADGQSLVSANVASGQLRRWNLMSDWPEDKPRWKDVVSPRSKPPFERDIQAMAVSPDGKTLVVALDDLGAADAVGGFQLQTWDFSRRILLTRQPPEPGRVAEIVFLGKEGERIAIRGKRKMKASQLLGVNLGEENPLVGFAQCWDHVTCNRISELVTPPLSVFSMPDTTHQYSAVLQSGFVAFAVQEVIEGANPQSAVPTIGIWNLNTGERAGIIPESVIADVPWILCSCQTPQGERLAVELTGSRHPDFLQTIASPKKVSESDEDQLLRERKRSETFSQTKQIIVSLWDVPLWLQQPKDKSFFKEFALTEHPSWDVFTAMTIDSTGSLLAGVSVNGECSVHDLPLGLQALQLSRVDGNILHLSFSADGRSLAVVTQPESVIYPVGPDEKYEVRPSTKPAE